MPDKPVYRSGLLSRVVFAHVGELVSRGVRARLEEHDLPPLPPASRSAHRCSCRPPSSRCQIPGGNSPTRRVVGFTPYNTTA